ncbi:MAG TPA: hypothetical protein VD927_13425 [Chryseosolibacter sp.]|nr:hypothetical protein [Chryseosolibacter sp.]
MKTTISTIHLVKVLALLVIILFVGVKGCNAQFLKKDKFYASYNKNKFYVGFEAILGVKTFRLKSNIEKINNMWVGEEGGTLGVVVGNDNVRLRLQAAGFYYSSASVKHTTNYSESAAIINAYPLEILNGKKTRVLNVYVSGGIAYSTIKFHGHYLNNDAKKINYSSSQAPYLGKSRVTSGVLGAGISLKVPNTKFCRVFSEFQIAMPIATNADAPFANTSISKITTVNLGICFGSGI